MKRVTDKKVLGTCPFIVGSEPTHTLFSKTSPHSKCYRTTFLLIGIYFSSEQIQVAFAVFTSQRCKLFRADY